MPTALEVLRERFGYRDFRFQQDQIIESVLARRDAFVLMPTGGGKSLCYQLPALLLEGLTVVISPLIALMKDQVDGLKLDGIPAAFLNSTQTSREQAETYAQVRSGRLKLLYIAPEKFFAGDGQFLTFLKSVPVALFAIDEAHCISHWGHDFRPEYLELSILRENFPDAPLIALTATADHLTQKDILEKLRLREPRIFVSSFNRENIHYFVVPKKNSYGRLVQFLGARREDSGIVYALSRNSVDKLAADLRSDGFQALPYHAGLAKDQRHRHQDLFIKDEVKVMVATVAFGMGIDKSNVRYVVHMDLPKNLESYYQETGRAGRDGLKSEAVLLYSRGDVVKLKRMVEIENNRVQTAVLVKKLNQMAQFCETRVCRRKFILNYFGEEFPENCASCDVCLNAPEKFDGTELAQKALSAVARLGERFGVNYTIDFLRGSRSDKMREEHKALKTYGVGADVGKEEWRRYILDLIEMGLLEQTQGEYPVLKLTEKSRAVLRGEESVLLARSAVAEAPAEIAEKRAAPKDYEEDLFKGLKALRLKLANQLNVPAYLVFSDKTLVELATYLPQSLDEVRQISGFGEIKVRRYGLIFMTAVLDYCKARGLESRISLKARRH